MDREDPLQVVKSSDKVAVKITHTNPRGRPALSKAIRFCPQPKSIVSQLLSNITKNLTSKTENTCKNIESDVINNSITLVDIDEVNGKTFERYNATDRDINTSEDDSSLSSNQIEDESHEDIKPKYIKAKHNLRKVHKPLERKKTYSLRCPKDFTFHSTRCNNDDEVPIDSVHCCGHSGCNYRTKLLTNLTKHKRVHSNERPYMCDKCTFRSNYVNSLKAHKRTHTCERPYCCHLCGYRCNSTSNLKKHLLHKHKPLKDGTK